MKKLFNYTLLLKLIAGYGLCIPFIILYIVQPLFLMVTCLISDTMGDTWYIKEEMISELLIICPPISLIWIYQFLSVYIDDPSCELEYIRAKNKWPVLRTCFNMYCFVMLPELIICLIVFHDSIFVFLFIFLIAVSYLYCALAYFLAYLFKSALIIIPVFMSYSLFVTVPFSVFPDAISYRNLFYASCLEIIINSVVMIFIGVIFSTIGKILNRRFYDF